MTFLTSFARSKLAVVTAETRVRWRMLEGNQDPASASIAGFTDDAKKLKAFPWGFVAGGLSHEWNEGLIAALGNLPGERGALRAAVRAWAAPAMEQLERETPAIAQRIRSKQLNFLIGEDGRGLFRLGLDWSGGDRMPGTADDQLMVGLPAGVSAAELGAALRRYRGFAGNADAPTVVRAAAELYAEAYRLAGPNGAVSEMLVIALITYRNGRAFRAKIEAPASELLKGTSRQMKEMCEGAFAPLPGGPAHATIR